jgi:hypothetical protein
MQSRARKHPTKQAKTVGLHCQAALWVALVTLLVEQQEQLAMLLPVFLASWLNN